MTLGKKTLHGVSWNALSQIILQVISIVTIAILARILNPTDFGLYSMIMVFIMFFQMIGDMGTSSALVHKKELTHELINSVFFLNLSIGVIFAVCLYFAAPLVGLIYRSTAVVPLVAFMSVNFMITSLGMVHQSLLVKEMEFKKLAIMNVSAALAASIISIWFASRGFGAKSLVIQAVTNSVAMVLIVWKMTPWRPTLYFSYAELKKVISYTANLTGFNVINYFARNADNFIIGRYLGEQPLGVYSLAYKLMLFPLQRIGGVIIRVLFPAFSRIQDDDEKFRAVYLRVIFFIACVTFPLMLNCMALSDILIRTIFGEKWMGVSEIFFILAPVGMLQSIVSTVGLIYMAKGSTKTMFKIGALNAVVTVVSFVVGLPYGIKGIAIAYSLANYIMLYPNLKMAYRQIKLSLKTVFAKLQKVFYFSVLTAGISWFFYAKILASAGILGMMKLLIIGVVVGPIYVFLLFPHAKDDFAYLKKYV